MDYFLLISQKVSDDSPSGSNLEDDSEFQNFFFEAEGTPEKYDGQNTTPAEPPEWRNIKKTALEYLKSTKDLKLVSVLAQSVLNTEGLLKFEEILSGISNLIIEQWDTVYPPLDEDDGDPIRRLSALGYLSDSRFIINTLKTTPLAKSKRLGIVSLKDVEHASNLSPDDSDYDQAILQIKATFKDCDQEEILSASKAINNCIEHLQTINDTFEKNASNIYSVDFTSLIKILTQMQNAYEKYAEIEQEIVSTPNNSDDSNMDSVEEQKANSHTFNHSKLSSRKDIELCIDQMCEYFAEYEPSSPVPLLLKRSKKLLHMNFIDIMKEIATDGLEQVNSLGGIAKEE
ncbi:type VI secretion system protein TssA [Colwellia sp. KU-HH00111]|uniref:type VI secretion system protein TssA n=1 Tax=Colwellia sp. KU-HH00111 TaxID=3127652 RepID=UPI0031098628